MAAWAKERLTRSHCCRFRASSSRRRSAAQRSGARPRAAQRSAMARSHRAPPVVMATPPAATGAAEGHTATSFAGRESAAAPRGARLAEDSNRAAVTGDVPRAGVAERRVAASGLRCVSPLATGGCGLVPARCVRARDRYRRTTCLSRTTGKNTAFEAPETGKSPPSAPDPSPCTARAEPGVVPPALGSGLVCFPGTRELNHLLPIKNLSPVND